MFLDDHVRNLKIFPQTTAGEFSLQKKIKEKPDLLIKMLAFFLHISHTLCIVEVHTQENPIILV